MSRRAALCCLPPLMAALLAMALMWGGCRREVPPPAHPLPDTLTAGFLYSPTGFFILRGDTLGYDYDMMAGLARSKGMVLRVVVASSLPALLELLDSGVVDVAAHEVPITAEYRRRVIHCGAVNETYQVLVQHTGGDTLVTDVTQLVGRDIYVERGSKYESRLRNLDAELGGGLRIHSMEADTLTPEDLIGLVQDRQLPLTVVDSDIARLNHTYYDSIDISLRVGFPQRSSWAVSRQCRWLADSINVWARSQGAVAYSKTALQRYFELNKSATQSADTSARPMTPAGAISPYDSLFRAEGAALGWDWKMLAAVASVESGFDPDVVSWAGARGIMQLMPSTAQAYGVDADRIADPAASIRAGAQHLRDLDAMLAPLVPTRGERLRFVYAAYNAGVGHVLDAIELAKKYDKDPQQWYGNVEETILWKSSPQYYNDPVCRYGYFRGRQTVNYVVAVEQTYSNFVNNYKDPPAAPSKSKHGKRR